LIDLSQVLVSNVMMHMNGVKSSDISENLVRHIILNSIRSYIKQFEQNYGRNVVICCDGRNYWRKSIFPHYKAHRKKNREASTFDWNKLFELANKIRDELKVYMPYKVIDVVGAEADDIVAVLTKKFHKTEKILILSSDKDYVQLQKYGENVQQYSPIMKRFIKTDDPLLYVKEHIIKGDRGDGIPNILSEDSVFVKGNRQKPISTKKLDEWVKFDDPAKFCSTDQMKIGYFRNQNLVDFDYIPDKIVQEIEKSYEESSPASKSTMLGYFAAKNMKNLIAVADEF